MFALDTRRTLHKKVLLASLVFVVAMTSTGCRLCCDPDDGSFAAYGGSWERTRRDGGRVGSLFDPAGAKVADLSERDEGIAPDVKARTRRAKLDSENESGQEKDAAETEAEKERAAQERERELQERLDKVRESDMENINVIPGPPVPPSIH